MVSVIAGLAGGLVATIVMTAVMNVREVLPKDAIPSIDDPAFGTAHVGEPDVLVLAGEDALHAFADPGNEFERVDGAFRVDGTRWDPVTGESEDGRRLERVPAKRLFAFAWQDDHGPDAFYREW
jgi:hypothetical protein